MSWLSEFLNGLVRPREETPIRDILVAAFRRGRAWHPDQEFANLWNLDETAVRKMTGQEADAKLLIRSLQLSDLNYDQIVEQLYQRRPLYDGEAGPAVQALLKLPRCNMPDFAPPKGAQFWYDDSRVQAAVESQQRFAEAQGRGSWPFPGCDPQRQGVHSIRIGISTRNRPSGWSSQWEEIKRLLVSLNAEKGLAVRIIENASPGEVEVYTEFKGLSGNTIGLNYFPEPDTCHQTIRGYLDPGYSPSNPKLKAGLWGHENTGHGIGLNHTRGGIMNPSILLVDPLSWVGDPSEPTVNRYFGGKPLGPPPPPPPPPPQPPPHAPTPTEQIVWSGTLAAGEYQFVKKNGVIVPTQIPT